MSKRVFFLSATRDKSFFMIPMSHKSSYDSVSGFSPKVRIRVGVTVRVTGVSFFFRLNILTHDSFTH